ncbi:MAG: GTP cyclohydrolase I FolE [Myxococcales bacterium]|nr:GTP cyclohydrolase I FolE [Myxococcales bacterium]MCB9641871.1 GTP cyclohydrolase I FolE [Myxococcales bacterium]
MLKIQRKQPPSLDPFFPEGLDTPVREEALDVPADAKIARIAGLFEQIMETLGLDLHDDSLRDTPKRFAKMYVQEIFRGLDPHQRPRITTFENRYQYKHMLVERDIRLHSCCEHHFLPILGRAHVAYIPNQHVVGLSKLNRIVDYYARRPQVQERLTQQIALALQQDLETPDVAVWIEARHLCVVARGIQDDESLTVTAAYEGRFQEPAMQMQFLAAIGKTGIIPVPPSEDVER